MDIVQALGLPTIGEDLFHRGFIVAEAVNSLNRHRVVDTPLPNTPLGEFERWRWVAGRWVATVDRRGEAWYNPDNTDEVFRPQRFDDLPPAGWTRWQHGQNRVARPAEVTRKQWADVRARRNALLSESDWVVVEASERGGRPTGPWIAYRQALRDITAQGVDPDQVVWPAKPGSAFGAATAAQRL